MTRYIDIPIDKLVKAEWNYKTDDPDMAAKLLAIMERYGQLQNTLVRQLENGFFEVVNGNHRLDVLKELGFDGAVCLDKGEISTEEAMRIAAETNEARFPKDDTLFAARLADLSEQYDPQDLAKTICYTPDEIKHIIDTAAQEIEDLKRKPPKPPKPEAPIKEKKPAKEPQPITQKCPHCGLELKILDNDLVE